MRGALLLLALAVSAVLADDVVTLTPDNFKSLVLNSNDVWLIEFYGKKRRSTPPSASHVTFALFVSKHPCYNSSVVRSLQEPRS